MAAGNRPSRSPSQKVTVQTWAPASCCCSIQRHRGSSSTTGPRMGSHGCWLRGGGNLEGRKMLPSLMVTVDQPFCKDRWPPSRAAWPHQAHPGDGLGCSGPTGCGQNQAKASRVSGRLPWWWGLIRVFESQLLARVVRLNETSIALALVGPVLHTRPSPFWGWAPAHMKDPAIGEPRTPLRFEGARGRGDGGHELAVAWSRSTPGAWRSPLGRARIPAKRMYFVEALLTV